jgi:PilZ domain
MDADQIKNTFADRRSVPRFSPNPATVCQVHAVEETSSQPATVLNISSTGIKIAVQQPVQVGTPLILTLSSKIGPFSERTISVRVMRASQQEDGSYALGCAFQAQLTGHELLALAL